MLIWRHNFLRLSKTIPLYIRLKFSDSAYNAGYGNLIKRRELCKLRRNCDPDIWDNNVANMNPTGNRILYGKRRAVDINNEHVSTVFKKRFPKYIKYHMNDLGSLLDLLEYLPPNTIVKILKISDLNKTR